MAGAYDSRNVGAKKGLYGLPPAIAWYGGWLVDSAGNRITGATDYTITFTADQLPKARFFWSATLYTLPQRLLSANEIDRYSIGDRTPGVHYGDDGSLTLYVQHRRPTDPPRPRNWLPSPEGPFTVIIRAYGGDSCDRRRQLPAAPHHATLTPRRARPLQDRLTPALRDDCQRSSIPVSLRDRRPVAVVATIRD